MSTHWFLYKQDFAQSHWQSSLLLKLCAAASDVKTRADETAPAFSGEMCAWHFSPYAVCSLLKLWCTFLFLTSLFFSWQNQHCTIFYLGFEMERTFWKQELFILSFAHSPHTPVSTPSDKIASIACSRNRLKKVMRQFFYDLVWMFQCFYTDTVPYIPLFCLYQNHFGDFHIFL